MKVERMEEKQIKAFVGFIQNICPNAIFDYKKGMFKVNGDWFNNTEDAFMVAQKG